MSRLFSRNFAAIHVTFLVAFLTASLTASISIAPGLSFAQDYPARPVRIVLGFPAGGSVDIAARVIGQKLSEQFGQAFVVENRPGAIGTLAMNAVATLPADGYTILLGTNPQVRSGMDAQSDPYRAFDPIALCTVIPMALLAHPGFPASSPRELAEVARKASEPIGYATPGRGSPMELAMETLKARAGLKLLHVPYNGGPPAVNGTVAGQVPLIAVGLPTALGQVRAGRLKPIAVLQETRTELLPGTPTIREALDMEGMDFLVWLGFYAPARTPPPVLKRLESEIEKALADPQVRSRLTGAALDVRFEPGARLAELVRKQFLLTLDAMKRYKTGDE